jgi:hypothetical protein
MRASRKVTLSVVAALPAGFLEPSPALPRRTR